MKKLWIFGCSISDSNQPKSRLDYVKWKGYEIKSWSELLSDKLDFQLENYAVSGGSNLTIMEEFSKNCNKFKSGDIVIINWTEITRFRMAFNNEWLNILNQFINHPHLEDKRNFLELNGVDIQTIVDITNNRESELFYLELDNWYNLIYTYCNAIGVKLIFWGVKFQ